MRREHPSQQGYAPFSFQDTGPVSPSTAKPIMTFFLTEDSGIKPGTVQDVFSIFGPEVSVGYVN
jgi:hypothetical protein